MITPINARENNVKLVNEIALNSQEAEVSTITFTDMVNDISSQTGENEEEIIEHLVKNKKNDLLLKNKTMKSIEKEDIIEMLRETNYIKVWVGQFPTYKSIYQPRGISFYGEGYSPQFDKARMTSILNIVFDRNNLKSGASYPASKQFSGNIFAKLESSEKIYFSIDGDFFNNGTTTYNSGVSLGIGDAASISVGGSYQTNHFAYIYHTDRWNGYM